jgi:hypothetical protein
MQMLRQPSISSQELAALGHFIAESLWHLVSTAATLSIRATGADSLARGQSDMEWSGITAEDIVFAEILNGEPVEELRTRSAISKRLSEKPSKLRNAANYRS